MVFTKIKNNFYKLLLKANRLIKLEYLKCLIKTKERRNKGLKILKHEKNRKKVARWKTQIQPF